MYFNESILAFQYHILRITETWLIKFRIRNFSEANLGSFVGQFWVRQLAEVS